MPLTWQLLAAGQTKAEQGKQTRPQNARAVREMDEGTTHKGVPSHPQQMGKHLNSVAGSVFSQARIELVLFLRLVTQCPLPQKPTKCGQRGNI